MLAITALLVGLPLAFAAMFAFAHSQKAYAWITRAGAVLIIGVSAAFAALTYDGGVIIDLDDFVWIKYIMLVVDAIIAVYIIRAGIRRKSPLLSVMAALQLIMTGFYESRYGGAVESGKTIFIDKLSVLMVLLVGVIGSLICVYAIEYMKDYHRHHPEIKDRRPMFFATLFLFMSAMFGLVVSNDMSVMLFFWEITSLCSFLLIGYTQTEAAVKNSLTAIITNVFGGLCFSAGIIVLAETEGINDILGLIDIGHSTPAVMLSVFLIACAGLTKSAQFPFSKWLLGAMVAPTPTSAMLHSSTMVKAGVFLIIRLAPMLGQNTAGVAVTLVGGITFLIAALLAIGCVDAKRVLAYSTISNLGLIVACAGINTPESIWAAVMLIVFHAIAKSLLFLAVGSTEHQLGSREIEDMDGLYKISRTLTFMLIIGIAGMFLAPFGMLISKWAAMKAFIDSNNIIIVLILCFGSSLTLFFWTKWLGKLIENANRRAPTSYKMRNDERVSMFSLAAMVVIVCAAHPLLSEYIVAPFVDEMGLAFVNPIGALSSSLIMFMMSMLFVLPVMLLPLYRSHRTKNAAVYLAGQNAGDGESFYGSMGAVRNVHYSNWYLKNTIKETPTFRVGCFICGAIAVCGVLIAMGGVLL